MVTPRCDLQSSCWQHIVVPLDQMHDGDDQDTADAAKVMWEGNRTHLIGSTNAVTSCSILRAEVEVKPSEASCESLLPGAVVAVATKGICT